MAVAGMMLTLISCDKDEPAPPTKKIADRTVLVYMIANNNLGSNGYDQMDIDEMCTAAEAGDIGSGRLLLFHAPYNATASIKEVTADGVETLLSYDDGFEPLTYAGMKQVYADMARLAPARDYGLVLWSHGTGWIRDGIEDATLPVLRSFGDDHGRRMNTSAMARAIGDADVDFSFLYFDCCYMMSVETLYELRGIVPLVAGSVTEIPSPGMPYDQNIKSFFATGKADIVGAATNTFNYYNSKSGSDRTCTMSVVSPANLDALAQAVRDVYQACGGAMPTGYVPQRFQYLSVSRCVYFDLADYIRSLCTAAGRDDLRSNFDAALANVLIYNSATPKLWDAIDLDRTNGLSTYILTSPTSQLTSKYYELAWYRDVASVINFE